MFAKLVVTILACGACGGALLSVRHARLQAAHEMAEARLRIRHHERDLQRMRAEISMRITPEQVEAMSVMLGPLQSAVPEGCAPAPPAWWLPDQVAEQAERRSGEGPA
ncbi:MAG: hypothetical protein EA378_02200 [Phycisphaerales bacterium]|nr:MAG: hypothetical protein EA378_02200 [Phycisphaerales bacterium]